MLMGAVILQAGQYGRVKHFLQIFLGEGRALDVSHGTNLHCTILGVHWVHWSLPVLSQVNENLDILSEVTLGPNQDKWSEGGMLPDLWNPLLRNILEGCWADDTEAQQEHICTGVAQRAQLVELILSSCVTQL